MKKLINKAGQYKIGLQALKESEARFRNIVLWSPDAIIVTDAKGKMEYMNPAAEGVFNRKVESFIGKDFGLPLVDGESTEIDIFRPGKDPGVGDMHTVETGWLNKKAHLITIRDITERKKIEQLLREHEREVWFAAVLKSIGDGMIVTDNQGRVTFVNPVAEVLTGWKQEEAKGLPLKGIFNSINEETGKEVEDPVVKVIREGTVVGLGSHTVLIAKDGTRRTIDDNAAPIKDSQGSFIGVVLVFRDVTERRKAEKKMQEAMQAKSAFTSMVSHELRTPLGALKEGVSLVSEGMVGPVNEEQKRFLGIAKSNVDRLARFINEVLDFQTLEYGKVAFKMQKNDINEVVKEAWENMLSLAKKHNLDFTLNPDENLPKVRFDRDKINQVLINLVNNSIKLTEKGSISITTGLGNNVIQVSIKDTGPGIKEEDMPRLFQQYEQLERKTGGTGLGLAISLEIIKAHGGKIWAESKFGQGTTMHFILPIEERRKRT